MDSTKAASEEITNHPVGQLLTPLTGYKRWSDTFAVDNGAFTRFREKRFLSILEREYADRDKCLFVACPDVLGDARRTLEIFDRWHQRLQGWNIALVAQDGIGSLDVPWEKISAIFIGGTTEFKNGPEAVACAKAAKILGKWVHVGRVNTPDRYKAWEKIGADSCDGSGLARYSWMRKNINDIGTEKESEDQEGLLF